VKLKLSTEIIKWGEYMIKKLHSKITEWIKHHFYNRNIMYLVLALFGILLADCGRNAPVTQPPLPVTPITQQAADEPDNQPGALTQQQAPGPMPGFWEGNVFTSEYLGLRFTVPDYGWRVATDEEIAEEFGLGTVFSRDGSVSISEFGNIAMFIDMVVDRGYLADYSARTHCIGCAQ